MRDENSFSQILKPPTRPGKPRKTGIVVVSDYGCPVKISEMYLETTAELIDYIKFTYHVGTVYYLTDDWFKKKIELYHRYNIGTFLGGIPFQMAIKHGNIPEFLKLVKKIGFSAVEIAEDVVQMATRQQRADAIKIAKDLGLEVITELGRKFPEKPMEFEETATSISNDIHNGAKLVTIEHSDIMLLKETNPEVLVNLVNTFGLETILFEVGPGGWPDMAQWIINNLGPEVNLGNIKMKEVIPLEGIRAGLSRLSKYKYFEQNF
ncbi:MAG: phosphosulfolactate synthase [Bacillota bacterium]